MLTDIRMNVKGKLEERFNILQDECVQLMGKHQMMQVHLKAGMLVMLKDLDLQIDELAAFNLEAAKVQRLIRDKINALKGDTAAG